MDNRKRLKNVLRIRLLKQPAPIFNRCGLFGGDSRGRKERSDGIAYRYGIAVDRVIGDHLLLVHNYKRGKTKMSCPDFVVVEIRGVEPLIS